MDLPTKIQDALLADLIPLLGQSGLIIESGEEGVPSGLAVTGLNADGSSRRFLRVSLNQRPLCLAVFPATTGGRDLAEAHAAWHIGRHLRNKGVPVPALYGQQESSGAILFEDLGDVRLYDLVAATDFTDPHATERLQALYEETIALLLAMQIEAADEFDERWCWDTSSYDRELMVTRESGYFLRSFWQDMLGCQTPDGLEDEFQAIAAQASEAPARYFLHRDFQSRNIMIKEGQIRIIDFQGGRRGPLLYDLASLLTDPYAALPAEMQEHLLHFYMQQLGRRMTFDISEFYRHYSLLALQRNLQIVGAFAFLSRVRGKDFFASYIRPAVIMLANRLQEPIFDNQEILRRTVASALELLG